MPLRILHTNDLHGKLTPQAAERLRALDRDLFVDSGDCIATGNLGVPLVAEKAWKFLAEAGCDVGTLGNRETHVLESAFRMKIEGCRHTLVCANLSTRDGRRVLPPSATFERAGLRIGVVGVMVPMVTDRMKSRHLSAYLWSAPIPAVAAEARRIRESVDVLVAITHIGHTQDRELATACPEIDVILGGHSHTVLDAPQRIGKVWICQGGSHGRYVGSYEWTPGIGMTGAELIALR